MILAERLGYDAHDVYSEEIERQYPDCSVKLNWFNNDIGTRILSTVFTEICSCVLGMPLHQEVEEKKSTDATA